MKAAHLPGARSRTGGPLTGGGKLLLDSGARLKALLVVPFLTQEVLNCPYSGHI
jgi:hypothetical protein